jgi:surface antigen
MRTRTRVTAIALICPLVLGGCQQTLKDNRDLLITAAAGVGGAVAGSFLGKGSGKLIATGAGAAVGVLIGSQIARYLDEQDKKAIEETTQEAVSTAADGQAL